MSKLKRSENSRGARKSNKKSSSKENILSSIKSETKQGILTVVSFLLAVIFVLASVNYAGPVGKEVFHFLSVLLGVGYYLIPLFFLMLVFLFLKLKKKNLTD